MALTTITRRYHKDDGAFRKGDVVREVEHFPSIDEAIDWGEAINDIAHLNPWHVTSVSIDSRNFCCFDLEPFDTDFGMADVEWREIKVAA